MIGRYQHIDIVSPRDALSRLYSWRWRACRWPFRVEYLASNCRRRRHGATSYGFDRPRCATADPDSTGPAIISLGSCKLEGLALGLGAPLGK